MSSINNQYTDNKFKKCENTKCTYKCDTSYTSAIKYLDTKLKPIRMFCKYQYRIWTSNIILIYLN